MSAPERIGDLLFRYLRNELSQEEESELTAWRNAAPENEAIFQKETNVEQIRSQLKDMYESKDEVWKAIREKIGIEPRERVQQSPVWYWVAAGFVVLLAGLAWMFFRKDSTVTNDAATASQIVKNKIIPGGNHASLTLSNGQIIVLDTAGNGRLGQDDQSTISKPDSGLITYNNNQVSSGTVEAFNILQTPRGGQFMVVLADGTKVWLNAASSLRYPVHFSEKERAVELNGEAYFEVAKNPDAPFTVQVAGQARVTVLGTHFNLMAYGEEPLIKTTLLEGKLKVKAIATSKEEIIVPGEEAAINTAKSSLGVLKGVDTDDAVAWKNGRTFFRNADLPAIMRMISRWYDVDVDYSAVSGHRDITGGISRTASLDDLLQILELNKIHIKVEGKKLIVVP